MEWVLGAVLLAYVGLSEYRFWAQERVMAEVQRRLKEAEAKKVPGREFQALRADVARLETALRVLVSGGEGQ